MSNSINAIGSRGREYMLSYDDIYVDETYNIRADYGDINGDDLSTIETQGIKQALIGFMHNGKFVVCDGFRRMRKVKFLIESGKQTKEFFDKKIPCKIDQSCETQEGRALLAIEMSSAKPLSMLEQGLGFLYLKNLKDEQGKNKYTLQSIADHPQVRKSRSHVIDCLALVEAPEEVKNLLLPDSDIDISPTALLQTIKENKGNSQAVVSDIMAAKKYAESLPSDQDGEKTKVTRKHIQKAKENSPIESDQSSTYNEDVEKGEIAEFLETMTKEDWLALDIKLLRSLSKKLTR